MTKKENIEKASELSGLPQTQTRVCVEAVIMAIL